MSDAGSGMEVCPYCKKSFKRLKSHLPHCKMIGPAIPAGQQAPLSQPATPSPAKKETRPARVTKAKKKALETESETSNTKLMSYAQECTAESFPVRVVYLKRADTTKAGKEIPDQNQLSSQVLKHTEPKMTLQGEMTPQSCVSDAASPKRELVKDRPELKESPCHPSETEVPLLVGSMEHSLSNQDKKYSLVLPNDKPATSANLKSDTVDPQRLGLLVKLLDGPPSNSQSPETISSGIPKVRLKSVLSKESSSRGGGDLAAVSPNPGNTETQGKTSDSLVLGLHTGPLGKGQDENQEKELGRIELFRSKGNAEKNVSPTDRRERASLVLGYKNAVTDSSAATVKPQEEKPLSNLFAPPEATYNKLLSIAESRNQSLAFLTVKSLQEEKAQCYSHNPVPAVTVLVQSKEKAPLELKSACHHHEFLKTANQLSYLGQHPVPKGSLICHVAAESKPLPSSVGLEWFPELYPGYVGLGVLPRKSPQWNSVAQIPLLTTSQGGSVSQVPWLERSSTDRSSEAWTKLTTSTSPVMRLLGAMHKGWMQCNTTIKKSGVGGLSVLFAGYFILCCNWSFRHLKLQRRRKS